MFNLIYVMQSAVFIYFSYLSGKIIIKLLKIEADSKILRLAYPLMLGYGLIGNFGLLLAVLGLFKAVYFYLLFAFIIILSRKELAAHFHKIIGLIKQKEEIKNLCQHFLKNNIVLKIIIFLWIAFYFLISFLPSSMGSDGLAYHLPFAFDIIEKGKIVFPLLDSSAYGHLPLLAEIFYAIPILLFKNIIVFKILQFSTSLLLLLVLHNFTVKIIKNKILIYLLIAGFLSLMPFQSAALAGGFTDAPAFLYGLASFLILVNIFIKKNSDEYNYGEFLLSAVFLAFCLSIKYIAFFFAVLNGLLLLSIIFSRKKSAIKIVALYAAPIFLLSGFWYLKNFILTGNPLYPISFFTKDEITQGLEEYLVLDRKLTNFFIFPFLIFGRDTILKLPFAFYNACLFAFMYLAVIFLAVKKRFTRLELVLFSFMEIYLLLLFYWTHQIRFAAPALIILLILNIIMLDKIISLLPNSVNNIFNKKNYLVYFLISFVSIILFIASANSLKNQTLCLLGKNDPSFCLARTAGAAIYGINYINQNLKNQIILNYWNPFYGYFLENGNRLGNTTCGQENDFSDQALKTCLNKEKIVYLLDDSGSRNSHGLAPERNNVNVKISITDYFMKNADKIFEYYFAKDNSFISLYHLKQ